MKMRRCGRKKIRNKIRKRSIDVVFSLFFKIHYLILSVSVFYSSS